jgi:hypothetical protein
MSNEWIRHVYLLITYYLLLITPKPSSKDRALDPIMKVKMWVMDSCQRERDRFSWTTFDSTLGRHLLQLYLQFFALTLLLANFHKLPFAASLNPSK